MGQLGRTWGNRELMGTTGTKETMRGIGTKCSNGKQWGQQKATGATVQAQRHKLFHEKHAD